MPPNLPAHRGEQRGRQAGSHDPAGGEQRTLESAPHCLAVEATITGAAWRNRSRMLRAHVAHELPVVPSAAAFGLHEHT